MTVQRNDDSSPQSSLRSPSWFYTSFTSNVTTTPSDRRTTIHVRTSAIPSDYSVSLLLPLLPFSVLCVCVSVLFYSRLGGAGSRRHKGAKGGKLKEPY